MCSKKKFIFSVTESCDALEMNAIMNGDTVCHCHSYHTLKPGMSEWIVKRQTTIHMDQYLEHYITSE